MRTPVALLVFNRPDLTKRVFDAVRITKPPVLFIAADGPRPDRPDDVELCARTRDLVTQIDWPCDVHLKFEESNLGCGPAVAGALDWVFGQVERAIILEDDCVPDPSFFPFCDELLERFADDARVMQIAGSNLQAPVSAFGDASYSFASFGLVWGWATWRRAWEKYDLHMATWPSFRDAGLVDGLPASRRWRHQLRREWDRVHAGDGTWDHQWQYTVLSEHGLAVYPNTNLISNLGFRADATQTVLAGPFAEVPVRRIDLPLRHPVTVSENPHLERFLEREILRSVGRAVTLLRRVLPSHRARQALRRVILRSPREQPS